MTIRRIWEVTPITGAPTGYEKVSVASTPVTLNPPVGANRAWIKVVNNTGVFLNMRDDGVSASATDGMILEAGDTLVYDAINGLSALTFIRDASATANGELRVLYYAE